MDTAASAPWARYMARPGRAACVISDLDDLHGPAEGVVMLPLRLYWSGPQPSYSLDDPWGRQRIYEIVLRESMTAEELAAHLRKDYLIEVWQRLFLPKGVRRAWEERHPVLAAARTAATAVA